MSIHLQREIEKLKSMVLALGALVEERVRKAIDALDTKDMKLATEVIDKDDEIDRMEVELEEECLKALALHQPVAIDLRFIVTVIKINNELERVGDMAVNIAQRAIYLCDCRGIDVAAFNFKEMVEKAQWMLKTSLDALVNMDQDMAVKICLMDDEVDAMKEKVFRLARDTIQKHPEDAGELINVVLFSRHLERISDHATNIAEDVLYLLHGEIVRHRLEESLR